MRTHLPHLLPHTELVKKEEGFLLTASWNLAYPWSHSQLFLPSLQESSLGRVAASVSYLHPFMLPGLGSLCQNS